MTMIWRRRVVLTASVAVTASVTMVLIGANPRIPLVVVIVGIGAAIIWLTSDVAALADEIDWERHAADRTDVGPRSDLRVNLIRARLHRERGRGDDWASTADDLTALVDARLRSSHRIDRQTEPDAAAAVLGPELTAFMDDPDRRSRMCGHRSLPATLTLIERL